MQTVTDFPRSVREIEHMFIRLGDGTRLAARIWLPEDAEASAVPAILEYLPYRKNDHTFERDAPRGRYFAGHGYAYVRVDLRGTGESDGVMVDEYTAQELQDGAEVIAWIAEQEWSDGGVGMVGISWGGFNGLQIAAMQPPALKAVVSICSTDDRYADDVHYMGGTLLCEQVSWASHMFGINTLPPDPRHVGEEWRGMWMARLKGSGLWLKTWMEHQTRDDFWKHGSICEEYSAVRVPVYAVSGWADGYPRTVFRLMENLPGPVKGLVGPWAHKYPHLGVPGPAIDWLAEELRWWDHWLKGARTGIMDEPRLRLFMQDHAAPQGSYEVREGRWVTEPAWPSPNVERTPWALNEGGGLSRQGRGQGRVRIAAPPGTGLAAGKWCSYAKPGDQPADQGPDDAGSAVFETPPLERDLEIAGDAVLRLAFTSDRPVAQIAARLVDVAPDGAATRVTYGLLNLTHRGGHEHPAPLEPGQTARAEVPLKHVAQTFRKGHRLRLALSDSYFPMAWPAPEAGALVLDLAQCALVLPERAGGEDAAGDFGPPVAAPGPEIETIAPGRFDWRVERGAQGGTLAITDDEGTQRIVDNDLTTAVNCAEHYGIGPDGPEAHVAWHHEMRRGAWQVRTQTETAFTSTATDFVIRARLRAWEGDTLAHEQEWNETIPRNLV